MRQLVISGLPIAVAAVFLLLIPRNQEHQAKGTYKASDMILTGGVIVGLLFGLIGGVGMLLT